MTVEKVFCKFTDGAFGRRVMCRKGKPLARISSPVRTKHRLFSRGSGPMWSACHQTAGWSAFYHMTSHLFNLVPPVFHICTPRFLLLFFSRLAIGHSALQKTNQKVPWQRHIFVCNKYPATKLLHIKTFPDPTIYIPLSFDNGLLLSNDIVGQITPSSGHMVTQ